MLRRDPVSTRKGGCGGGGCFALVLQSEWQWVLQYIHAFAFSGRMEKSYWPFFPSVCFSAFNERIQKNEQA